MAETTMGDGEHVICAIVVFLEGNGGYVIQAVGFIKLHPPQTTSTVVAVCQALSISGAA